MIRAPFRSKIGFAMKAAACGFAPEILSLAQLTLPNYLYLDESLNSNGSHHAR